MLRFSFKSVPWLPLSSLAWALMSDTNAVLATSTQYISHGEGIVAVQNDFKWVALYLTCLNSNMACQGSADISDDVSSSTAESTQFHKFAPVQRHPSISTSAAAIPAATAHDISISTQISSSPDTCFLQFFNRWFDWRDFIYMRCNQTNSSGPAVVTVNVMSPPIGTYQIFVLNEKNWNKFTHGVNPDCLNDNCYDTLSGSVIFAWTVQSYEPTQAIYVAVAVTDVMGGYFSMLMSIAPPSAVYNLTGMSWRKQQDSPAGCSESSWPSAFVVSNQHGILYLLGGVSPIWSVLRVDVSPARWSATTSDNKVWRADIASNKSFSSLTWSYQKCQVVFNLVGKT